MSSSVFTADLRRLLFAGDVFALVMLEPVPCWLWETCMAGAPLAAGLPIWGEPGSWRLATWGLGTGNCGKPGVLGPPGGPGWPLMCWPFVLIFDTYSVKAAYGASPGCVWQKLKRGFIWPIISTSWTGAWISECSLIRKKGDYIYL